jgi:hypothetical protein
MALTFELATFSVREADEASLVAERPQMIAALGRAFPGLLAAWLAKRDDGSWIDVILWRSREEAEHAAKHVDGVPSGRRGSDTSQSHTGCSMSRSLTRSCSNSSAADPQSGYSSLRQVRGSAGSEPLRLQGHRRGLAGGRPAGELQLVRLGQTVDTHRDPRDLRPLLGAPRGLGGIWTRVG